jgi:hypothetical protein
VTQELMVLRGELADARRILRIAGGNLNDVARLLRYLMGPGRNEHTEQRVVASWDVPEASPEHLEPSVSDG